MEQKDRRKYLIRHLIDEQERYKGMEIPEEEDEQKMLLRSLMNVRYAAPLTETFKEVQDAYLKEENEKKGIVDVSALPELQPGICLWQGDITRLAAGAIVNAANSGMTGCYRPCHNCIDNCIHTYAGIELRNFCNEIMEKQGRKEETGLAKITPAFNLPAQYVIHTVGPIVQGSLRRKHEKLLESCYLSCLRLADAYGLSSIVFCCISTGVFCFPPKRAAEIAVGTVKKYREETGSDMRVIFNVFKDSDLEIYREILK